MFFVSQVGPSDCAFTCLKILLANYHKDKNYLFLPCEDKPYSFKDLENISREYHMEMTGIKVEDYHELFESKDFPFIATLDKRKGVKHSVILLGISKKYVRIFDPESGKRRMKLEDFYAQWDGKALVKNKDQPSPKMKCPNKATDFIDKKDKYTLPIWQLLSGVSLLTGVYFINKDAYFFIPIIFFSLFLIFEIIFRKSLISALKRMDSNFFSYQLTVDKSKYYDVYQTYEKYRYTALSIIPNLIYTMMISIFATALLIMNGVVNLVYIAIALAIAILHVFIYKPYFQLKSNEIGEEEKRIYDVNNQIQFNIVVERAHKAAYQVALSNNLITYVEVAVLLMSAITLMSISGVVSVIYVIFYLCISIYLKDNFVKMLEYSGQSEEFDNYLAKLLHYVDVNKNNSIE